MCHGNLKLKFTDGSPKLLLSIDVYIYMSIIKISGNKNSPTFSKSNGKIPSPRQKHGDHPLIQIYASDLGY